MLGRVDIMGVGGVALGGESLGEVEALKQGRWSAMMCSVVE